jgi:Tol biopolymer transport system component
LPWLVAGLALLAAAAGWLRPRETTVGTTRAGAELAIALPPGAEFAFGSNSGWGVVSPDGKQVVLPAIVDGERSFWIRPLASASTRRLPGTQDCAYPFWAADSRNLAFYSRNGLMKIDVNGGSPERICASGLGRGGDWGTSGRIVFNAAGGGGISLVSSAGGEPVALTEVDAAAGEDAHYWPVWLPGEKSFLYFIRSGRRENQGIYRGEVVDGAVDRARRRIVASSASGLLAPAVPSLGAMLLWAEEDRLLARALAPGFDRLDGPIAEVARGVRVLESQRATMASVSGTGTLVFASSAAGKWRVGSYDRSGRALGLLPIAAGDLHQIKVSPDGSRFVYVAVQGGQGDLWVHELATGTSRALTSSAEYEEVPTWSSDGRELLYRSGGGPSHFRGWTVRADGEGAPRPRVEVKGVGAAIAWLSDDRALAASEDRAIGFLRLSEGSGFERLEPRREIFGFDARFSHSAQALAYASDDAGQTQGFVVSIRQGPEGVRYGDDHQRVPVERAQSLRWRPDGRELYAVAGGALWAVPVERRDGRLRLGAATKLFAGAFVLNDFDVYDGGQRFLFRVDPEAEHQTLGVVLDWPARVARATP